MPPCEGSRWSLGVGLVGQGRIAAPSVFSPPESTKTALSVRKAHIYGDLALHLDILKSTLERCSGCRIPRMLKAGEVSAEGEIHPVLNATILPIT